MLERDEAIKVLRWGGYLYRPADRLALHTFSGSFVSSSNPRSASCSFEWMSRRLGHARLVRPTTAAPMMVGCLVPTSDISKILNSTPPFQ